MKVEKIALLSAHSAPGAYSAPFELLKKLKKGEKYAHFMDLMLVFSAIER